jgi:uncharacterized membrane protein YjjP (DUF1212 family)
LAESRGLDPQPPDEPTAADVELLVGFARAGHAAGYPTADLEERLLAIARHLGLEGAQVSSTPTLLDVSFGRIPYQRTFTLRVNPGSVDLDAIARLDDLVGELLAGRVDSPTASEKLAEIRALPLRRRWFVWLGAYALAGAAVTPVLGGHWRELAGGAVVGLIVGVIAVLARRLSRADPIVAPLAAVAASFAAVALAKAGLDASPDIVTLAALVTFLPGMTLTIGMRELATQHLQSGVANSANALVQLLGLVFGVGVGRSIAVNWFGLVHQSTPHTGFGDMHLVAAVAAGLAFTVTLRAPTRSAPAMCSATLLAILANAAGKALFGAVAGVFVSALALGLVGNALGARFRRSPLVFIVPGVLMLVPGSAGFNSVLKLLTGQTVTGVDAGFNTFVTAMSIAYGLMISTLVVGSRLAPDDRPEASSIPGDALRDGPDDDSADPDEPRARSLRRKETA